MDDQKVSKQIIAVKELNYTDVKESPYFYWNVAVLPWGSIEPHGEHLSYMTDTLLAHSIAYGAVKKASIEYNNRFIILPSISMGQQNLGQVNKKFCINYSLETISCVLYDTVKSLSENGINKLVIINGHNGNDFKPIVRDLATEFPEFRIYVCNYLSIVEENKNCDELKEIPFTKIDDHAAFTETSLMQFYYPQFTFMNNLKTEYEVPFVTLGNRKEIEGVWSPRNFDKASINTRIGDVGFASGVHGAKIAEFVTDKLSMCLIKIYEQD